MHSKWYQKISVFCEAMTAFKPDCRKDAKYFAIGAGLYLPACFDFFFATHFYRDLDFSLPHSVVRYVISTLSATL